ncbi:hypothetical protein J3R30DRAFT_625190 [Lentinula aciculospora]|uniref:Uncharacterized protein n=1 Tax=Lentinula aciculospora TaxID=153920 RepID=A0A9W9A6V7_9AGAR|nr:hypothetical protein J3R30DRAFT_625190 [Lentinula aciculospora]
MDPRFTALRSKYEHVITQQQNYHRDLEAANAKTKKMQEEIDLLLEALMTTTPPAPSIVYLDIPTERNMHYSRPHGMEHILETSREKLNYFVPRDHPTDHENSRSTHTQANGETNGNPTNGVRRHSVEPESELNPNYMSRESNGRIPNS